MTEAFSIHEQIEKDDPESAHPLALALVKPVVIADQNGRGNAIGLGRGRTGGEVAPQDGGVYWPGGVLRHAPGDGVR
jgi:hypothetical protein